jgi:hypothetical protein
VDGLEAKLFENLIDDLLEADVLIFWKQMC